NPSCLPPEEQAGRICNPSSSARWAKRTDCKSVLRIRVEVALRGVAQAGGVDPGDRVAELLRQPRDLLRGERLAGRLALQHGVTRRHGLAERLVAVEQEAVVRAGAVAFPLLGGDRAGEVVQAPGREHGELTHRLIGAVNQAVDEPDLALQPRPITP